MSYRPLKVGTLRTKTSIGLTRGRRFFVRAAAIRPRERRSTSSMKTSDRFPRTRTSPRRTPMLFAKRPIPVARERASCRARDLRPRTSPTTGMRASRRSESGNARRSATNALLLHLQVYYSRAKWAANLQRQLRARLLIAEHFRLHSRLSDIAYARVEQQVASRSTASARSIEAVIASVSSSCICSVSIKTGYAGRRHSKWENKQYRLVSQSRLLSHRGRTRRYSVKWSLSRDDGLEVAFRPTPRSLHHVRDKWSPFAPR